MRFPVSLLIIPLIILSATPAYASHEGVKIPLVADYRSDSTEQGILLYATVLVKNGSGHVFVDTSPYTQVDLQGSARLAAMVASDLLNEDQRAFDFYYIIDVPSPIIGGPSAGGALTVATIAAMKNWTLKPDVVMTGMINPDESIGPVGGIPAKLEAAASKNATLFLIPAGQNKVTVQKTVTTKKGAFVFTETQNEEVDIIDLGKKLNVTVREAGNINDALNLFTGHRVEKRELIGPVLTQKYMNILKPLATSLSAESRKMYEQVASLNPDKDLLKQAHDRLEQADKYYKDEKNYAATSVYFNGMILLRSAQWNKEYMDSSDKEDYLELLSESVSGQINSSKKDIELFKKNGIVDVEATGAAESRVATAESMYEEAIKLEDVSQKINLLAFANERARTAQWWLTLANSEAKMIPDEVLKDRAGWYLSQAQSIQTYANTLLLESGVSSNLITDAGDDIDRAQKEIQRGYYAGALFDALGGNVKASTAIGLIGGVPDLKRKANQSQSSAQSAIIDARKNGIEPTLAVSAYEYAETLADPKDRIVQYSYARMVAKTAVILDMRSEATSIRPVKPNITYGGIITPASTVGSNRTGTSPGKIPSFEIFQTAIVLMFVILIIKKFRKAGW